MRNRMLLSKLATVLIAATVFVSGCYHYMPPHSQMDGAVTKSSRQVTKADLPGYTVAMVEKALQLYDAKGREATVDYYNSSESVDGEWYVFIADENNDIIAHPNPDFLGESLLGPMGVDITGYRQGEAIASVTEEGKWVNYMSLNYATDTSNLEYKHTWVVRHDGLIFGSGWYQILPDFSKLATATKANRAGYPVHLVEQAIQRYDIEGREATIDYYNSPENADGEWYVFIADENNEIIATPNPDFLGESLLGPLGVDITGYRHGEAIASATEEGKWVDYIFLNPATGTQEYKHSWVVKHDGLIFASGWYQILPDLSRSAPSKADRPGYAVHLVEQAIQRYQTEGRDAAIEYLNSPENLDGEWYAFAIDETDIVIGHPREEVRGQYSRGDEIGELGVDITGYNYGELMHSVNEDGLWVDYFFLNPATGNHEYKHTWVVRHDGLIFGSGWYQIVPGLKLGTTKADRSGYTVAMVEQALQRYEAEGREATVDYYNTPESVDGEWYVFIFDESDQLIAHANPDLLGMDLKGDLGVDVTGYRFGDLMLTATEEGLWVDYLFQNLATGNQEYKHSWVVRRDGLLFGSGWYQVMPSLALAVTKAQPAEYTVAMVDRALRYYKAYGREETVTFYNTPESVDGEWYVYIFDENDLLIAHANPDLLGQDLKEDLGLDSTGYHFGTDMLEATEEGLWVHYVFLNPATGAEQTKHSWTVRHDGLLIGSGWYE